MNKQELREIIKEVILEMMESANTSKSFVGECGGGGCGPSKTTPRKINKPVKKVNPRKPTKKSTSLRQGFCGNIMGSPSMGHCG